MNKLEELFNKMYDEQNNSHKPVVMQTLPLAFVKWYSGMEVEKILKAYERWQKESGIVSVGQRSVDKSVRGGCKHEMNRTHKSQLVGTCIKCGEIFGA